MQSVNIEEISLEFTSIAPSFFIWKGLCWKQKNMSEKNPPKHPDFHLLQILSQEAGVECFEKLFECVCVEDRFLFLTCKASHLELTRNTQQINKPSHFKRKLSDVDVWFFFSSSLFSLIMKGSFQCQFDNRQPVYSPCVLKYCRVAAVCDGERTSLPGMTQSNSSLSLFFFFLWMLWPLLCTRCGFPWSPFSSICSAPTVCTPWYEWFTARTSGFPPQECGARWKSHAAEPKLHSDLAMLCNSSESQCS